MDAVEVRPPDGRGEPLTYAGYRAPDRAEFVAIDPETGAPIGSFRPGPRGAWVPIEPAPDTEMPDAGSESSELSDLDSDDVEPPSDMDAGPPAARPEPPREPVGSDLALFLTGAAAGPSTAPRDGAPARTGGDETGAAETGSTVMATFTDGSYAIAKRPPAGAPDWHAVGVRIFWPDGTPRGGYEARRLVRADHVAAARMHTHTDLPGAFHLNILFATEQSDREHLDLVGLTAEPARRILRDVYGAQLLPGSTPDVHHYRMSREAANRTARQQLARLGWTVHPEGEAPAVAGGGTGLSDRDADHFYQLAKSVGWDAAGEDRLKRARHRVEKGLGTRTPRDKAREFVAHVVAEHRETEPVQRALDQLDLGGHRLYRATVKGRPVVLRARVDGAGHVVSARPATRLDEELRGHDHDSVLAELLGAGGWTVRAGHASTVDPDARRITLDFHSTAAWTTLAAAHAIATGPDAPPHLAMEYRTFRGAQILPTLRRWAHQLQERLTGDEQDVYSALGIVARRTAWEAGTPALRGPFPVDRPEPDSGCAGWFLGRTWKAAVDPDQPVDHVLRTMGHEMFHSEQRAVTGQWRANETGDPAVLATFTDNRDVQLDLWDPRRRPADDERYPAAANLWTYDLDRPEARAVNRVHNRIAKLARDANDRLAAARATGSPGERLLARFERGQAAARLLAADADSLYTAQLMEAQAFMYVVDLAAGGSVLDWTRMPGALVPGGIDGYDVTPLGTAGSFLRPAGSTLEPPERLSHPDRPLVVVPVADPADAGRVLRELRDRLPAGALVEPLLPERVTAERAVELAEALGEGHVLAIAADRVSPAGALVDHFVPYSRGHAPTLRPAAHYHTVHATPQSPLVRLTRVGLYAEGGERYELLPGWHAVVVGERVWIGPAGEQPSIEDDDPPVVIGTMHRDTPWTVWQHGLWVARDLASHRGTTTDAGFVRVHRPAPSPPPVPVPDPEVVHAVDARDEELLQRAFGAGRAVDPARYRYDPPAGDDQAGPSRRELGFTAYHLVDELLDLAGADPADGDPDRLVAALDDLAGRLGEPRRELLPVAYAAARVYGLGELTGARLRLVHGVLRGRHPHGPLPVGAPPTGPAPSLA
ncbi:hypothetical protein RB614_14445 [Phytohabitans sp. ZYX-F-186]|uniref:Uncharacterized protein n=1 Tax=Phytohabitans maris TaxID=3071409 RepID=A0ABU0ZF80_9ACTN|nr:hypothetical protein [Phytohabitans sp. ZYX-F-186]MDQ7905715.1 hypothetical protein [Phytohabitans sp. ZYX-F-186]